MKKTSHSAEWQLRFVRLAGMIASWSKDPSTKVGSVIVRPDKTIAGIGYNGFPRYISDDLFYYQNKDEKHARVIHSELNAIFNSSNITPGSVLYNWPVPPCDRCAAHIIQAGIEFIVYGGHDSSHYHERYEMQLRRAEQMYREAGVNMWRIDA